MVGGPLAGVVLVSGAGHMRCLNRPAQFPRLFVTGRMKARSRDASNHGQPALHFGFPSPSRSHIDSAGVVFRTWK